MKRTATAAIGLLLACGASAAGKPGELREFDASYAAVFRGINAGTSQLKLEKLPDNQWRYTSTSIAQGVFRVAINGPTTQRSVFALHEGQVRPHEFMLRGPGSTLAVSAPPICGPPGSIVTMLFTSLGRRSATSKLMPPPIE